MKLPMRVMFIDDSESDRKLFEEAVRAIDRSIECIMAETGYAALAYFSLDLGPMPDYVFLDINMHGMTGLECLAELKKIKKMEHLPVIMFTTAQVFTYEQTAKLLGAKACYTKSIHFEENVNIIAGVIGARLEAEV
jgi:CheY-like chemotaxis protein